MLVFPYFFPCFFLSAVGTVVLAISLPLDPDGNIWNLLYIHLPWIVWWWGLRLLPKSEFFKIISKTMKANLLEFQGMTASDCLVFIFKDSPGKCFVIPTTGESLCHVTDTYAVSKWSGREPLQFTGLESALYRVRFFPLKLHCMIQKKFSAHRKVREQQREYFKRFMSGEK